MWGLKEKKGIAKPTGGISEEKRVEEENATSDWDSTCEQCNKDYQEDSSTADDTAAYCSKKCEREAENGEDHVDAHEPYLICPHCKGQVKAKYNEDEKAKYKLPCQFDEDKGEYEYFLSLNDNGATVVYCPLCKTFIAYVRK